MTYPLSLNAAIAQYEKALAQLEAADSFEQPLHDLVLEVLLARDAVQAALEEAKGVPARSLLWLERLDDRFQQFKDELRTKQLPLEESAAGKLPADKVPPDKSPLRKTANQPSLYSGLYSKIVRWRNLRHPPENYWWWQFEPPALIPFLERRWNWLDRFDWLWTFLSLFFLTVSATVVLNTLNRVLSSGVDARSLFAVVLQTVLTLAGGAAALTSQGRQTLKTLLTRCRIPRQHWQELSALLSLLLLLIVIGIHWLGLPFVATRLYQTGADRYSEGQLETALNHYQQAIALNPGYTSAHYSLGILYEDLQKYPEAIEQYQLVVRSEKPADLATEEGLNFVRAHNNLGRLYLLQNKPQDAWIPLERGASFLTKDALQKSPDLQYEEYNLRKNQGWTRFQQKNYSDAAEYLTQAIELDKERAPAYCLRAQVLAAQTGEAEAELKKMPQDTPASKRASQTMQQNIENLKQATKTNWESCVQYATISNPDEALWIGIANEYLSKNPE